MSIKIAICDDNEEDIKTLSETLYEYDNTFCITNYCDGENLIEDCLDTPLLFDIIFLDIYMPRINGIEIAGKLRAVLKEVKIIFVSSSDDHYPQAYDVFAFNYLIKPINREKLNNVLDQALMNITDERKQQIYFNYKATCYRVQYKDILYMESSDKIILFHLANNTTLQCYSKLDVILNQVSEQAFIRCHQSYAVNRYHITQMTETHFCVGNVAINISKKFRKASKDKYYEYLFSHMNSRGK